MGRQEGASLVLLCRIMKGHGHGMALAMANGGAAQRHAAAAAQAHGRGSAHLQLGKQPSRRLKPPVPATFNSSGRQGCRTCLGTA